MAAEKRTYREIKTGTLTVDAKAFAAAEDFYYDTRSELKITDVGESDAQAVADKLSQLVGADAEVCCDGKKTRAADIVPCKEAALEPLSFLDKKRHDFADLIRIMRRLCAEDGCEWDKAQTHESIRSNAVEEAYELVEAINNKDVPNIREECGDVMLQSVFHCRIAEKNGEFTVSDALTELCEKLIQRHPHVFGDVVATNPEESLSSWEAAKAKEKGAYGAVAKMKRTAKALPAVERAVKVQKAAKKAGFDFANADDAAKKVGEELAECLSAAGYGEGDGMRRSAVCGGQRDKIARDRSRNRSVKVGRKVRFEIRKTGSRRGRTCRRADARACRRTLGSGESR